MKHLLSAAVCFLHVSVGYAFAPSLAPLHLGSHGARSSHLDLPGPSRVGKMSAVSTLKGELVASRTQGLMTCDSVAVLMHDFNAPRFRRLATTAAGLVAFEQDATHNLWSSYTLSEISERTCTNRAAQVRIPSWLCTR
eukprot:183177-Rhodomonas_salina.6